jgi:peptidoglycan/LPS O-acetylase OafA/YrhL
METALPAPRVRYQPALDGIRALAVLMAIGYHAGVGWLRGGFIGPDLFFVLSGYLITALLLAEYDQTGRIGIRAFYARRARRLLPALFLLLLGVAAYSAFVAYPGDRGAIRADALASLFYVQNWHLVWTGVSYFTSFAAPSPLLHLWSLAIEEQFYLVWPVALLLLVRAARGRRWPLFVVMGTATALSVLLMALVYHPGVDPSRDYYGTDTRAFELLIGALLAVAFSRASANAAKIAPRLQAAGLVAAAFLVAIVWRTSDTSYWFYRGGFVAVAVAVAVVIASVVRVETGLLRTLLCARPLRATGRISYGLFLWHWPVLLWLDPDRTGLSGYPLLVLRLAVTFAFATASFVFVERPVRAHRAPFLRGRRVSVATAIAAATVIAAVSASVPGSSPALIAAALPGSRPLPALPGPTAPSTTPAQRAQIGAVDAHKPGLWEAGDLKIQFDGFPLANGVEFLPGLDQHDGRPHIVMVGDSVLFTLETHFDPGPTSRADYYQYGQIACGFLAGLVKDRNRSVPTLASCPLSQTRWRMLVDRRRPDLSFLFVGGLEVLDHVIGGRRYVVGTTAYDDRLRDALLRDVDLFSSRGGLVVFPTVPCYDPKDYGIAGAPGGRSDRTDPRRVAAVNAVLGDVARSRPKVVRVVDLGAFLCPGGRARDRIDGVTMRSDGVHFTPAGAQVVSRWLAPRLEALIPPGPVFATVK